MRIYFVTQSGVLHFAKLLFCNGIIKMQQTLKDEGTNKFSFLVLSSLIVAQLQVVYKSSNPRWTASFLTEYEYGSQLLFFVDMFAVKESRGSILGGRIGGEIKNNGAKLMGRAVFDVQDILGTKDNVKAKRLPKGGV